MRDHGWRRIRAASNLHHGVPMANRSLSQSTALPQEASIAVVVLLLAGGAGLLAAGFGVVAVAIPILVAGGVLLVVYPFVGLLLIVATIPLESALMVGGRSAPALIGIGVFGTWAAQKLIRRESVVSLVSPRLVQVALLLLAFACLSMLWAEYPAQMQRPLILFFQLILLCVLVFDLASSWERIAWVAKLLVLAGTVAALLTLEQSLIGGARRAGEGVVAGVNRTAVTLVTILPFAFYLFRSNERAFWRFLGLAYIGLSAGAVAVTQSRMNYLIFPAVVLIHLLLMARSPVGRRRLLLLGAAGILAIATIPVDMVRARAETIAPYLSQTVGPGEAGEMYSPRGYRIRVGLAMFKDRPIGGVGFHNYRPQYLTYQWNVPGHIRRGGIQLTPTSPHSSHIGFLADLGSIGSGLWLALFAIALRYLWLPARAKRPLAREHGVLIEAIAFGIGLQLLFGFYGEVHSHKILWLLLGLALAVQRCHRTDPVERF
jgi:O-antigen ligase